MNEAWRTIARGRKVDKGHTAVATRRRALPGSRGLTRQFVRCQCGVVLSGTGYGQFHDLGFASHVKHQRRHWAQEENRDA